MKFSFCYSLSRCIAIALCLLYVGVSRASVVGTSGGSAGVNQLGAATYTLPIEVPKGVNGLQPNLSITYNSMSGNGVLGMGFSLQGLSAITRTTKSIYYDGRADGLNSGAFALDGQRLVANSSTEFVLENDPQMKIKKVTDGSIFYFQVLMPDGRTVTYGKSASCRSVADYAWYVERIEDAYGNSLTYDYSSDGNTKYLSKIIYGGNTKTTNSLTCVVSLNYETRTDAVVSYVKTTKCTMSRRLTNIVCVTNGSTSRRYFFKYTNTDAYSRLTEILVSDSGSNSFEPIKFSWSTYPTSLYRFASTFTPTKGTQEHSENYVDQEYSSMDIDGDGKDDIVSFVKTKDYTYIDVYQNTTSSASSYTPSFKQSKEVKLYRGGNDVNYRFINFLDLTGDGKKELIYTRNKDGYEMTSFPWFVATGTISSSSSPVNVVDTKLYAKAKMNDAQIPIFACADFDSNGTTDILMLERVAYTSNSYGVSVISYNTNTKSYVSSRFLLSVPEKPEQMLTADFNNDGLIDVMVIHKSGYKIFTNTGVNLTSTYPGTFLSAYTTGSTVKYEPGKYILQMGDFNGDGQVDFLYNNKGSYDWYIASNNGNGYFTSKLAITVTDICERGYTGKDDNRFQCIVMDYNYDGKDDAIIVKSEYKKKSDISGSWGEYTKTYYQWLKSNGDGTLVKEREVTSNKADDAKSGLIITGDFHGKGYPEIINYGADLYSTYTSTSYKDTKWRYYLDTSVYPSTSKISNIYDELNNSTYFSYSSLVDATVYTKGTGAQYPMIDICGPFHVVTSFNRSMGDSKNYTYSGLKAHLLGRGMLGFEKVVENNTTQGVTTETKVTAWNNTFYIPSSSLTTTKVGSTTTSSVQQTITYKQTSGIKYVVSGSVTKSTDMYSNVTTQTVTNNTTYGYPTEEKVAYSDGSYVSTVYSDYALVNGFYRAKTVTRNRKHVDDSSVFSQKKQYTYNTTGTIATEAEAGITKAYTYSVFGNVATESISGSGVSTIKHTYTYDTYNRFVVKDANNTTGTYSAFTYSILGNLLTKESPLTTKLTYDSFGRVKTETDPYGIVSTVTYGWGTSYDKKYYIKTVTDAAPAVTVWYDYLGREVEKNTTGEGGISVSSKTKYNSKGQISQIFNNEGDKESSMTYTYDAYGRIVKEESSTGSVVSYSYGNKTTTVNDNGRSTTKTFDAMGNVKKVADPITTVTYTYASNGQPKVSSSAGASYTMTYDSYGRRTSLTDPNAGKTTYEYDVLGRVVKQTDARGNVSSWVYDAGGRVTKETCGTITTSFSYGGTNVTYGNVLQASRTDGSESYVYDSCNRVTKKTKATPDKSFVTSYVYNAKNQLISETKPNNDIVSYGYDSNGFMTSILLNGEKAWELTVNSGLERKYILYSNLTGATKWRSNNTLESKKILKSSTELKTDTWYFDPKTGNLSYRQIAPGQGGATENFSYDKLDRLTGSNIISHSNGSVASQNTITYAANGNILTKGDVGSYTYSSSRPHAVSSVSVDNTVARPVGQQKLTYNAYNKVATVSEGNIERSFLNLESTYSNATYDASLAITYGSDNERAKSVYSITDRSTSKVVRKETRYYADNYEEVVKQLYDPKTGSLLSTVTNKLTYVSSPDGLVLVKIDGNKYCAFTDYLGSIETLIDKNGTIVFSAYYDAWGKQKISTKSAGLESFRRGYTGHEHLAEFGLINMNGRIYDPVLGRFLSPDPVMQAPEYSQNYNGYSYCFNNPMKFTDPNGKFAISAVIIGAIVGAVVNVAVQAVTKNVHNFWDGLKAFTVGAVGGAAGGAVGSIVSVGAGFVGGFVTGAAAGGAGAFASSLTSSVLYGGTSFGGAVSSAFKSALIGAAIGGLVGGVASGIQAVHNDQTFWTGEQITVLDSAEVQALPQMNQTGEWDCRYESFRSIEESYGDEVQTIESLRSKYPNVEGASSPGVASEESYKQAIKAMGKMYSDNNMGISELMDAKQFSSLSKMEQAKILIKGMKANQRFVYEHSVFSDAAKYGHATVVKSVTIYSNGKVTIQLMDPANAGRTIHRFGNLVNMFRVMHR